jgi:protein phosphatase
MIGIKKISYINNIGRRPQLEDSIYPGAGKAGVTDKLFLVCDGVGGENMGEEASRIACEEFAAYFDRFPVAQAGSGEDYLQDAQKYVLGKMADYAGDHPGAEKMSTTLTLAFINHDHVWAAWCGDSRIYHIRNGQVIWRSTDHSLVANLVKHGEITEDEASNHPQRNVITRSLSASGSPSQIDLHVIRDIEDGDYIMLCTDGVLEQINEDRLKGILENASEDKETLFLAYAEGKTRDNFSLYLLMLESDSVPRSTTRSKKRGGVLLPALIIVLIIALIAVIFGKKLVDAFRNPVTGKDQTNKNAPNQGSYDPAQKNKTLNKDSISKPATPQPITNDSNKTDTVKKVTKPRPRAPATPASKTQNHPDAASGPG